MSRPDFMEAEALLDGHVTVAEVAAALRRAGWEVSRAVHGVGSSMLTASPDDGDPVEIEIAHVPVAGPRGPATRLTGDAFDGGPEALAALAARFGGTRRDDRRAGTPYAAVPRSKECLDLSPEEALRAAVERVLGPAAATDLARAVASDPSAADALREALDAYEPAAPAPR